MANLRDHVAVVTGASSGIGKAVALGLAQNGADVCLLGRNRESLEAVAGSARTKGARALICTVDLLDDQEILTLATRLQRDCKGIDILVHSAGAISIAPVEDASIGELDSQIGVNFRAPCVLTKALLPMILASRGQIVFINSTAGITANANAAHYSATKHALTGFANSVREEVNGAGVRVLSIFVGRTATPMQAAVHRAEGKSYRPELLIQPEDVASMVVHALTLPRTAEITDIKISPFIKPA